MLTGKDRRGRVHAEKRGGPMSTTDVPERPESEGADMKLEVLVLPVSDVDQAEAFYRKLGWRVDAKGVRLLQFTPPGSGCSIQFGTNLTPAAPGSARNVYLVVDDMEAARADLAGRGVAISDAFREASLGGRFEEPGGKERIEGISPESNSYGSFATFGDPDGISWLLQEVTTRLPGRIDSATTSFASVRDLADAMTRASKAHARTRSALARRTRTGPIGTPPTWSQSSPGTHLRRDQEQAEGRATVPRARRTRVTGGCGLVRQCSQQSGRSLHRNFERKLHLGFPLIRDW
jgi:catechol 2,3-dioxygenase-like lactoylglutathione lyase family enzyme